MRLFTALDLPGEVAGNLDRLLDRLRGAASISWSPPGNLHVTTKFIGAWPDERLDELQGALAGLPARAPIAVHVHKTGFFPNAHAPRMFWCGIEAPGIEALAADTDRGTGSLGIPSETRTYAPHLTLARIRQKAELGAFRAAVAALPALDFGSFEARSFFLYRSDLRATGSVYTKLAEFPFSKP